MKRILIALSFTIGSFHINIATAQQANQVNPPLQGKMELTIDLSRMKDTTGRFMVMVGGEIFYPEIKNHTLTVHKDLQEPRKAFLGFYPARQINENPGKPLNLIAAEVSNSLDFLAIPGRYNMIVKDIVANSEMETTSPYQEKYATLLKLKGSFITNLVKENATLVKEIQNTHDSRVRDSLFSVFRKYSSEKYPTFYKDTVLSFVKQNCDEPASLLELEEYSHLKEKDLSTLKFLYNQLTERLKTLPTAKRIYQAIDEESFATNKLVGNPAPDFTQDDPSGHAVSLKEFKGSVTLLEFWASWCGPCRAANPALVATYKKYHKKGFRILGISLDNDKKHWQEAIKADGLEWTHISDLRMFDNTVAALYHIYSIPSNFLIDKSGKIIAANLDEKKLNEYLEKELR